ncbi:melanoma-associated antigen 11 [Gorilla gorilla gorilla]|uniref:MAGE family member A11 n=1 Tax=Gorilla gorilla gorilla TaxID=9595 RepID=G3S9W8_GORGO|nr:melanoma-associated antigen 11 isoform X1 [Gorilla gorilla gorilla]
METQFRRGALGCSPASIKRKKKREDSGDLGLQVSTMFSEDDFQSTERAPYGPQIQWSQDLPRVQVFREQANLEDRSPRRTQRITGGEQVLWGPITQIFPTVWPADLTRVIMPLDQRSQHCKPEEGLQAQEEDLGLVGAQALQAEEQEAAFFSSTLNVGTLEELPAAESLSPPQSPQEESFSPTAMDAIFGSLSDEGSSSQEKEGPSTLPDLIDPESFSQHILHDKIIDLVHLLLRKYRVKGLITKAEMLGSVIKNYEDYFPEIFREASVCMQLLFGIDVKEVDPTSHSYVLVTSLNLSYDGIQCNEQSMPKSGLLIIVLGVIFMEGNCIPEEVMWEVLSTMGVYAGREHFLFGEPKRLLTQDWVQEKYLVYRQVPGTDPACCEFLWGPRAHTETSKMKVLEYIANANGRDPTSYPSLYEDALREEGEGV